jgi:hypothetical protein
MVSAGGSDASIHDCGTLRRQRHRPRSTVAIRRPERKQVGGGPQLLSFTFRTASAIVIILRLSVELSGLTLARKQAIYLPLGFL